MNLRLKEPVVRCITVHVLGNRPTVSQLQATKKKISNVKNFIIESMAFLTLAIVTYWIAKMLFSF